MSTYVIGDVQGCYTSFEDLLEAVRFEPKRDRLWLVGDLVNRGPDSALCLDFLWRYRERVTMVLGNHELHLLACAAGVREPRGRDTIEEVLEHRHRDRWIDHLRGRPVTHWTDRQLMVHAGVLPRWRKADVRAHTERIGSLLAGPDWAKLLARLQTQTEWRSGHLKSRGERTVAALRALTMTRVVDRNGDPEARFKGLPEDAPDGTWPWFDHPGRRLRKRRIVFGHWAALGLLMRDDVLATDSACVWGRHLTAVRLEDDRVFQVPANPHDVIA